MAKRTVNEKSETHSKGKKIGRTYLQLSNRIYTELESDILRLFEDSKYFDLEIVVECTPIFTHSCILLSRASRFYSVLTTKFDSVRKNGFSSIIIYNASFSEIRQFIQSIYTNSYIPEVEDQIVRCLLAKNTVSASRALAAAASPDSDLFFTPKCSPSELQKPFKTPRNKESDVTSYYKIVSVDDVQIYDPEKDKPVKERNEILEKELAEQDKLFESFKSIISKGSKQKPDKPNSLPLSNWSSSSFSEKSNRQSKRRYSEKTDGLFYYEGTSKGNVKLPLWKPNPVKADQVETKKDASKEKLFKRGSSGNLERNKSNFNFSGYHFHLDKLRDSSFADSEISISCCSPDMDLSLAGGDSGLENSCSCQPEASPRENTVSETSGVDLTEAAVNEDIPHDEETKTVSSVSSEVGTWDGSDGKLSPSQRKSCHEREERKHIANLNEDEVARLDTMERNMKDCETFLEMERRCFCLVPTDPFDHKTNEIIDAKTQDFILENNLNFSDDFISDNAKQTNSSNLCQIVNPKESFVNNYESLNGAQICHETIHRNLMNCTEFSYRLLEHDDSSLRSNMSDFVIDTECNSLKFEFENDNKVLCEGKTPPCSPCKPPCRAFDDKKMELVFPEVKSNYWDNNTTSSNNYFIDASSLLDEDEIASPPVSLVMLKQEEEMEGGTAMKEDEKEVEVKKTTEEEIKVISKENLMTDSNGERESVGEDELEEQIEDISGAQDLERRQGELIFKNSIPHFSRHEIDEGQIKSVTERLRGGADEVPERMEQSVKDESEQVVPSSDVPEVLEFPIVEDDVQSPDSLSNEYIIEAFVQKCLPSKSPLAVEIPVPTSTLQVEEPMDSLNQVIEQPTRRISAESLPIVSGGVSPKDFSNPPSYSSSPHLRRRNESAPILSGGMEFVEEKKVVERKPQNLGEAWVVDFSDNKPPKRRLTTGSSDSDAEFEHNESVCSEKSIPIHKKVRELKKDPPVGFFINMNSPEAKQSMQAEVEEIHSSPKGSFAKQSMQAELEEIHSSPKGSFAKQSMQAEVEEIHSSPKGSFAKQSMQAEVEEIHSSPKGSFAKQSMQAEVEEIHSSPKGSFAIEKSASLGYFIDFSTTVEPKKTVEKIKRPTSEAKTKSKEKKNMFSMFIDFSDESNSSLTDINSSTELKREEGKNIVLSSSEQTVVAEDSDSSKKSFYMYIDSESPVSKRRLPANLKSSTKKPVNVPESPNYAVNTGTFKRTHKRTQSYTIDKNPPIDGKSNEKIRGSSQSLFDTDISSTDTSLPFIEPETPLVSSSCFAKLPLTTKSPVQGNDTKVTIWSGNEPAKDKRTGSGESWLKTNDVQVTYRAKRGNIKESSSIITEETTLKKDSTFIIDDAGGEKRYGKTTQCNNQQKHTENNITMGTLEESSTPKSPFKSPKPEERDSGVVATEESDDSFVKLSDLDKDYKNPYMDGTKKKPSHSRMSQSIPEASWIEHKSLTKTSERELMTRSIGGGTARSAFGLSTDKTVSRSLSRLFPNLNLACSSVRKSSSSISPGARMDTDPSDTQISEISEISSLQSSMGPSGLEISTSETDVSSHVNPASRLGEDLLRMFLEEISPDVVVEVGGRRMRAHKCILSSRCQYFAAMLSGGWVESAGNVISLQGGDSKKQAVVKVKQLPYNFDSECFDMWDNRDIFAELRTKFVPPKFACSLILPRKRVPKRAAVYERLSYDNWLRYILARKQSKWKRRRYASSPLKLHRLDDPWKTLGRKAKTDDPSDDVIDNEKERLGEGEESEQINLGPSYESWMLNHKGSPSEVDVFHSFWKGEGTPKSIRDSQMRMMRASMDTSVDPCQDFYQYACGRWAKDNKIPKDKAGYDTFEMLRESLDTVLAELLREEITAKDNDVTVKTKNLFASCMDEATLREKGEQPLLDLLEDLGGWAMIDPHWNVNEFDWVVLMARLRLFNNDILISQWVGPDIRNSDEYIIQFDQTSLGLPTREYFLDTSNGDSLVAYKNYLIAISKLLGASERNAKRGAEELINFETELAKITSSSDERQNVTELYDRLTVAELSNAIPEINWFKYLTIVLDREVDPSEPIVMFAMDYVEDLVDLLCRSKPRVVSNYLLWRFIRHRVNNLDDRFQEAKQNFYFVLFGREKAPPRWKNCVSQVNTNMGMGLGAMFVQRYFDEKSKRDTLEMTEGIMVAFRAILGETVWIDNETRRLAIDKVDAMMLRIGYPDFLTDERALHERYRPVHIDSKMYFENTLNILRHLTRMEQDRLGTRVNKMLWNTPPAVVNAYYNRNKNQIMFPAGILQPPFYHRYFPKSLNYGGIGVVIGHEITHGFDDKGRLFDRDGNLHRWWKDAAIKAFHERAQCLIDQYSQYTVQEVGMQIDGVNTQGENIADNGGIKEAFQAYEKWLSIHGSEGETLSGMDISHLQLFFLNFAQIWCGAMRPEATRNRLKTAVHPPGKFRVIGTLSNSEDFARVFQCEPGSPMNPIKNFSYNAVHFALCHIYSGESRIPDTLNIIELATLADMLCLEGLKEVISHTLKVKYCHCFHNPCSGCSIGVLDCLPVAAAYGLDDLYRKCLRWVTKYFVRVWPTKTFASLPKELLDKCYQHHVVHMSVDNVLDTILSIDKARGSLPSVRWAEVISKMVTKLHDAAVKFIADHFSSILTSDHFLSLGRDAGWSVSRLEDSLLEATNRLPPEQACWSHARLYRILSVVESPDPPPEMTWTQGFIELLQCIAGHVENSLIKQAPRAARSKAWRQMEPELRSRIQEAACLVLPDETRSPSARGIRSKRDSGQSSLSSVPKTSNRTSDLRQVKLAMAQQASRNSAVGRLQPLQADHRLLKEPRLNSLKPTIPVAVTKKAEAAMSLKRNQAKVAEGAAEPKKITPQRFLEVKSRYLEQKSPQKTAPEKQPSTANLRRNIRPISSSDSSRNCSPAMRRANVRNSPGLRGSGATGKPGEARGRQHRDSVASNESTVQERKSYVSTRSETPSVKTLSRLTGDENMSTDSLATESSFSEKDAAARRKEESSPKSKGKENVDDRRRAPPRQTGSSLSRIANYSPTTKRSYSETSVPSSFKSMASKKTFVAVTKVVSDSRVNVPKRTPPARANSATQKSVVSPSRNTGVSPRTSAKTPLQRNNAKTNGTVIKKKSDVDFENNEKNRNEKKATVVVSRSGTFLKDEPTVLKKPQAESVQDEF